MNIVNYSLVEGGEIVLYNQKNMKVRMSHILLADNILLDNLTNKVSAIGLFNLINIPSDKKSVVARFGITAQLVFDELPDKDVNVELSLVKPDGSVMNNVDMTLTLDQFTQTAETSKVMPLIVNFSAIEFTETGTYTIKVTIDGQPPIPSDVGSFEARKLPASPAE
jgi:hypothetical protein